MRLRETETGHVVCEHLELATTFLRRFLGLQFRRPLEDGHGLLLAPCDSVHTCWMRFSIDIVMLDQRGIVLAVRQRVRPWRIVWPNKNCQSILELPAASCNLTPQKQLWLELQPNETVPPALRHWTTKVVADH